VWHILHTARKTADGPQGDYRFTTKFTDRGQQQFVLSSLDKIYCH